MKGCGCMLLLMLASVGAMAFAVFLALQPIGEVPPPVTPEAAASFDQKLAGLMAPQGAAAGSLAFSEQELNSKLATTLGSAPAASPLKRIFVRLRPDNRVTAVGLGELLGRPIGGIAELQLVSADGVSVNIDSAHIGALPLPVSMFTGFVFPMMQSAGLSPPSGSAVPASIKGARIEGTNLILSR